MRKSAFLGLFLSLFFISGLANASLISQGTIDDTDDGSTVDYWYFSIDTDGTVTIDILAMGVDVNGDGTTTNLDPYIYLLSDDGALSSDDLIALNDDDNLSNSTDGSVHNYDSYLSELLSAGDYLLVISSYSFSIDEVVSGINVTTWSYNDGDYQITWSDNVILTTDVPEPPALALIGIALLGLCQIRRIKK